MRVFTLAPLALVALIASCTSIPWESENPLVPVPKSPLGISNQLSELKDPPTSATVRLGRWLFYDKRLSVDQSVSCATCHRPENAFSEPTPVSTGIRGQKGGRKAPSFINQAWTIFPHFFWDGRAKSLEEQALGPVENPIEMGHKLEDVIVTLKKTHYTKYFKEAFGDENITKPRIAKAIADYERTRMSGNSPWDRWKAGDESAVNAQVKLGDQLFFGKAKCNQCHLGQNFTDSRFHNLGVGWNKKRKRFKDKGRFDVTKKRADMGAFKTPGLREITKHAPYMHDGSVKTLEDVVDLYDRGGEKNPHLSPRMSPLKLTKAEKAALVEFMKALDGEGYMDVAPKAFPAMMKPQS